MVYFKQLFEWYNCNKRILPWRDSGLVYKIWVSEVILQQTRIDQGVDYYRRFIDRFPDVNTLAMAREDEVLKMWQGLGYYSRGLNMLRAAQLISRNYNGAFPRKYDDIRALPGIGDYTAAAISSIAFNAVVPAIDGNVLRVVARFLAIDRPVDRMEGKKIIIEFLNKEIWTTCPGVFNQAVMELGALVCKPKKALCTQCPLASECKARNDDRIYEFPVKVSKIKIRYRYLLYKVIIKTEDGQLYVLIKKRSERDIWSGLYDFPVREFDDKIIMGDVIADYEQGFSFRQHQVNTLFVGKEVQHVLTHQKLTIRFLEGVVEGDVSVENGEVWIPLTLLREKALPRVIDRYVDERWKDWISLIC